MIVEVGHWKIRSPAQYIHSSYLNRNLGIVNINLKGVAVFCYILHHFKSPNVYNSQVKYTVTVNGQR